MKHDDSETIIIAGALADWKLAQNAIDCGLDSSDFKEKAAGTVWSYFLASEKHGEELSHSGLIELAKLDGIQAAAEFYIKAASRWPGNSQLHERTLKILLRESRKRKTRRLAEAALEIASASDDEKELEKAARLFRQSSFAISEEKRTRVQSSSEVAARLAAKMEKPVRRLQTGIQKLDNVLGGGLDLGRVVSFIGKYKIGKTTLLSTVGYNVAYGEGEKDPTNRARVLFITLERNQSDVEMLNMCRWLGINMGDLERKRKSLEKKITAYVSDPERESIRYYHRPGANLGEISAVIEDEVRKHGIELVMIDYYQIVGRTGNMRLIDHLMDVDQTINRLAADLNIAIVIAAQSDADGNPRDSKTLLNSASANFAIRRQEGHPDTWLENLASNYRKQRDAGSPNDPAMILNEEKGPHFESC